MLFYHFRNTNLVQLNQPPLNFQFFSDESIKLTSSSTTTTIVKQCLLPLFPWLVSITTLLTWMTMPRWGNPAATFTPWAIIRQTLWITGYPIRVPTAIIRLLAPVKVLSCFSIFLERPTRVRTCGNKIFSRIRGIFFRLLDTNTIVLSHLSKFN
jgi:hypothetical protein